MEFEHAWSYNLGIMKTFKLVLFIVVICGTFISDLHAEQSSKPLPPVRVSVSAVPSTLSPELISPGDIVTVTITAVSMIETPELIVQVDLLGGTRLISGETSWRGPAAKGEEKNLTLNVQAPLKGKGRVRAVVSLPPSNATRFSADAVFILGSDTGHNDERNGVVKKDKKGRSIIEYH